MVDILVDILAFILGLITGFFAIDVWRFFCSLIRSIRK